MHIYEYEAIIYWLTNTKDSWDLRRVTLTIPQGTPEILLVGQEGNHWPLQLPGLVLSGTTLPSPVDPKPYGQALQAGDAVG